MACPSVTTGNRFLAETIAHTDCKAQAIGPHGYGALADPGSGVSIALTGLLTVFIAIFGYRLMLGEEMRARGLAGDMLKLGIALTLATSWPALRRAKWRTAPSLWGCLAVLKVWAAASRPTASSQRLRFRMGRVCRCSLPAMLILSRSNMPMNAPPQNIYLESYLAVLAPWLERPDLTDIFINRPGELWFEILGSPPERCMVPELTGELLARMVKQIAAVTAQGINREHPLLSASLPDGTRVQAVIPPATRGDIALAFRKHLSFGLALEDYRASGAVAETRIVTTNYKSQTVMQVSDDADVISMLRDAVLNKRNTLVSGGTSSSKTTFVNALLREIPSNERLILIEDTPELQVGHQNVVGLIAARSELVETEISAADLLIASLQMRPDRIILGEIRGSEGVTFLRAINTGHPGSISTIHADSPERALDQIALLVMETGTRMGWDDVTRYVRKSLVVIVQLRRADGTRKIDSVARLF